MTVAIHRLSGHDAYDLIYPDCLAKLPEIERQIMHRSMHNSTRVWIGCHNNKVACFWGLVPPTLLSDRAYLWLYTTPDLDAHIFLLVRHSQRMVEQMLEEFPIIVGHCGINDRKAIRWLKWLGAQFGDPPEFGAFIPFIIKANNG